MYTLKDTVAEGLSRLFSDSSNHSTPDLSQVIFFLYFLVFIVRY